MRDSQIDRNRYNITNSTVSTDTTSIQPTAVRIPKELSVESLVDAV